MLKLRAEVRSLFITFTYSFKVLSCSAIGPIGTKTSQRSIKEEKEEAMKLLQLVLTFLSFFHLTLQAFPKEELKRRQLESPNGVIPVKAEEFETFFSGDKDYYLVTLLTTTAEGAQCELCHKFEPVFQSVSNALTKTNPSSLLVFFVKVEANENLQFFKQYQISTVPHLWVFPISSTIYRRVEDDEGFEIDKPKGDIRVPWPKQITVVSEHYTYTITETMSYDDMELHFAKFLSSLTNLNIVIDKPNDPVLIFKYAVVFFALFKLLKAKRARIIEGIQNGRIFLTLSIIMIVLSLSGLNYAMQRNIPFVTRSKEGEISFLIPGVQQMIGSEIVVSAFFQICFIGILVLLVDGVNSLKGRKKPIGMLIFAACLFLNYNVFTSLFLIKHSEYPFNFINIPVL